MIKGHERKWGPLSKANAWRAGTFWEDMDRDTKVFIEEEDKRKEVDDKKPLEGGNSCSGLKKRYPNPTRTQWRDDPTQEREKDTGMDEVDREETQKEQITSLAEKVASLERENEEKERRIQELEMKVAILERAAQESAEKRLQAKGIQGDCPACPRAGRFQ